MITKLAKVMTVTFQWRATHINMRTAQNVFSNRIGAAILRNFALNSACIGWLVVKIFYPVLMTGHYQ